MLEEERNKYFDQARQATLAEIGSNQQAMLDNAFADVPEYSGGTLEPAVVVDDGPNMNPAQGQAARKFQSPINPNLVAEEAMKYPAVDTSKLVAGQAQPEQPQFQNPINPNLVAEAAQNAPGIYVGHGMTMPAGLAQQANDAAAAAIANPSPTPFDDVVSETDAIKAEREKQAQLEKILNPQAMRAESSRKWIAGIGDALASVANMVGTGRGGSNQQQTYSLPGVNAAIEADRKRRGDQYQRQLDRMNKLEIQEAKNKAAEAERAFKAEENEKTRKANKERYEAEAAAKKEENDRKFDYQKEKDDRTYDLNEWKTKQQIAQGWARVNKGNNSPSGDDGEGDAASSRYTGKRGGGIKEAKVDYNAMLDEVAENYGCANWADLENQQRNDRNLRAVYNKFGLGKDKGSPTKIEAMISENAKNYAPKFWAYYFGKGEQEPVNIGAYKPKAGGASNASAQNSGGKLGSIMSSNPQGGKKKRNK